MQTIEQTASTVELHLPVIFAITVTLASEQSTEFSKGPEVVSSRFQIVEYCLPKTESKLYLHLRLYPLKLYSA